MRYAVVGLFAVLSFVSLPPPILAQADPQPSPEQALLQAAWAGDEATVRRLLEEGVDLDVQDHDGHTALHGAASAGHAGVVRLLLDHGAGTELTDAWGRTPLLLGAREAGNPAVVLALLEHGAEVNALDRSGASSLELAAWRGFGEVVDLLLDHGAIVDPENRRTAWMMSYAVGKGLERLFGEMAEAGVSLETPTENGGSLLHAAAEGGSVEIIRSLLDEGFEVTEADRYGWTPLHYAAERGRTEVSELLIARGADVNARTVAGHTPLSLTYTYGKEEEARLLEAHGGARGPAVRGRTGPWMGEDIPGTEPKIFARDLVSSNRFEHGTITFSSDGREAFWESSFFPDEQGYSWGRILTSRMEGGEWTEPVFASFSSDWHHGDDVPFFSPDGDRLFFSSLRPVEEGAEDRRELIWVAERTASGWGEPRPLEGGPNSMGMHWQFSVAGNGSIYFGSGDPGGMGGDDLYVSRLVDGIYQAPENLGPAINTEANELAPFIATDESFLIFTAMDWPGGLGGLDLYISFRDPQGEWTEPLNMGEPVNSPGSDLCPHLSPDGAYLFWNSQREGNSDNYWMDAGVLDDLRRRALGER